MKKIIFSLMIFATSVAHANSPIFPQIFNFGNSVQVQIFNPNLKDVNCSGMVYMNLSPYGVESQYFYGRIPSHTTGFRTFFLTQINVRIAFASHSIYCTEI
jgi:hypothetical protein